MNIDPSTSTITILHMVKSISPSDFVYAGKKQKFFVHKSTYIDIYMSELNQKILGLIHVTA